MQYTINVRGKLVDFLSPQVMGILNVTPDSFFAGSRKQTEAEIADRANQVIAEGGTIIDVGAFSTRPGAPEVSQEEEMARLRFGLEIVRREQPDAVVSVDTFRPDVARMAVEEYGADIINDVSEGGITGVVNTPLEKEDGTCPAIFRMVARLGVPYILMSVKPNVETMLMAYAREIQQLRDLGVKDIILDPGFGFGKTLDDNYRLMAEMDKLHVLGLPLLVGVSRKSMIFKLLDTAPAGSLNGTTVLHTLSLMKGVSILRAHDVREAVEAVKITSKTISSSPLSKHL
ncbi:MAG: dihydropteroate synthase [Prevotella sp.]